jgi:tol-pal system protein YbgF
MINGKKHVFAAWLLLVCSLGSYAQAPVVDDSDNFALLDEQQPAARAKYDEPQIEPLELDSLSNNKYQRDVTQEEDGPALAKDDATDAPSLRASVRENAALIGRIQTLHKEVQELRGQLEVQANDLKKLQEQQLAFYKDIDTRLSNGTSATTAAAVGSPPKPTKELALAVAKKELNNQTVIADPITNAASRVNPADEQIRYLAAYELVKNKQYDQAIESMNTFVQRYPQSGYTANAQYWLGELFLVKKDYIKAIRHFDIVLRQFPSSSKSAASLLKAGYAYAASGNNLEAKKRLQDVIKNYPGTATAELASLKLHSIKAL